MRTADTLAIGDKMRQKQLETFVWICCICTIAAYNYGTLRRTHRTRELITNMDAGTRMRHHQPITARLRHSGWYNWMRTTTTTTTTTTTPPNDLFDDYEDDMKSDYEDIDNDDDPIVSDWQAEEATDHLIYPTASLSPMTEYKFSRLGTRSRVEETRREMLNVDPEHEKSGHEAAIRHFVNVQFGAKCQTPHLRVISIQDEHPNRSKTYSPKCTLLHRCTEDTGCCPNYNTKCGPKTQILVYLYVYVKTLSNNNMQLERLAFYNHTECACLDRNKPEAPTLIQNNPTNRPTSLAADNYVRCKCPETFVPKYRYSAACSCDCDDDNLDCQQMKKGKEFISMLDRRCILRNDCGTPECEYGVYDRKIGRCPRREEKVIGSYKN